MLRTVKGFKDTIHLTKLNDMFYYLSKDLFLDQRRLGLYVGLLASYFLQSGGNSIFLSNFGSPPPLL